jgi:hypothetical protein
MLKGEFTIVEVKVGIDSSAVWGRLKSGAGWIALMYCNRLWVKILKIDLWVSVDACRSFLMLFSGRADM